jgi:hypothetical protein
MAVSQDEQERWYQMYKEKRELDWQSMLSYAKKDGRLEGERKGEMKIIELLKSGKSPEEIIAEFDQATET